MAGEFANVGVRDLARVFANDTVFLTGVRTKEVYAIFREVHRRGAKDEFEKEVGSLADKSAETRRLFNEIRTDTSESRLIPAILKYELSGTEKDVALDIWNTGEASHEFSPWVDRLYGFSAHGFENIGAAYRDHPILATGATIVGGALVVGALLKSSPCIIAGGIIAGIGAVLGVGKTTVNEWNAARTDDQIEKHFNHLESGAGVFDTALSALGIFGAVKGYGAAKASEEAVRLAAEAAAKASAAGGDISAAGVGGEAAAVAGGRVAGSAPAASTAAAKTGTALEFLVAESGSIVRGIIARTVADLMTLFAQHKTIRWVVVINKLEQEELLVGGSQHLEMLRNGDRVVAAGYMAVEKGVFVIDGASRALTTGNKAVKITKAAKDVAGIQYAGEVDASNTYAFTGVLPRARGIIERILKTTVTIVENVDPQ